MFPIGIDWSAVPYESIASSPLPNESLAQLDLLVVLVPATFGRAVMINEWGELEKSDDASLGTGFPGEGDSPRS